MDGESSAYILVVLSLICRSGAASIFYIVYVLTPEMFPTLIRQATTSMCSAASRLAAMVLPFFMYSGKKI